MSSDTDSADSDISENNGETSSISNDEASDIEKRYTLQNEEIIIANKITSMQTKVSWSYV